MKKNALIALSMIMLSVFSMTFTSCGSDDDDAPAIVTPDVTLVDTLYRINGTSEFTSIEFTESGLYVITKAGESSNAKGWGKFVKSKAISGLTRSESDSDKYIHGKYTKADNVYTLEGFGTITVEKDGDIYVSLKIQPIGKEAYTLSAQPVKKVEDSDINNKLCHAWKFEKCKLVVSEGDSVLVDTIATKISKIYEILDSVYHENNDTYVDLEEIIYTKSGTYIATYSDNTIKVSQWKWKDEKKGIITYYSGEEKHDPYKIEDVSEISFDENNNLVMNDTWYWTSDTDYFTFYFSKIK